MTDPNPLPDEAARAKAARERFIAVSLFRLSGALVLVFGLAIAQQQFGWVHGQKARIMGVMVATLGFVQMVLIPRLLLRAWASPTSRR